MIVVVGIVIDRHSCLSLFHRYFGFTVIKLSGIIINLFVKF
jgi:hypothetical protein